MTRDEIKRNSITKELEKLETQLAKRRARAEKKMNEAEKLGMNIPFEEWCKVRDTVTQEQFAAYFELSIARNEVEETEKRISRLSGSLEKVNKRVVMKTEQITAEEAERRKAEEIKRWAEDGITVEVMAANYIWGKTPRGESFRIEGNNGITERSLHCFTLEIGGKMVFSSGEFYRAYRIVKES